LAHFTKQADDEVGAALFGELDHANSNAIRRGAARAKVGDEHRGSAKSIDGIELEKIVSQLEVFADFDWRKIQALFESRAGTDGHAAWFDRAGFRGVQSGGRPCEELS